jgi:hypothetical protein
MDLNKIIYAECSRKSDIKSIIYSYDRVISLVLYALSSARSLNCNGSDQRVARQQLCKHDPTPNIRGGCFLPCPQ